MQTITIQGAKFQVPSPFTVGYTLQSDGEAAALNQVYAENLRNNFASKVKEKKNGDAELPEDVVLELQRQLEEYAGKYAFGVRSGRGPAKDPLDKEMVRLARDDYVAAFRAKYSRAPDKEMIAEAIEKLLDAKREDYATRARRILRERQKTAESVMEGLV